MREIDPLWIRWPYARVRRERDIQRGEIQYFISQLEYDIQATPVGDNKPDWRIVARFDHNTDPDRGHDIREEGLHLDIYKYGEKHKVRDNFPYISLSAAPEFCDRFFKQNAPKLLHQFERWHNLSGPWRTYSPE
jgi:hypothetical protein